MLAVRTAQREINLRCCTAPTKTAHRQNPRRRPSQRVQQNVVTIIASLVLFGVRKLPCVDGLAHGLEPQLAPTVAGRSSGVLNLAWTSLGVAAAPRVRAGWWGVRLKIAVSVVRLRPQAAIKIFQQKCCQGAPLFQHHDNELTVLVVQAAARDKLP